MAVRTVGKIGLVVSFPCFPLAGKAVLCYGKDSFWLRKRLFYGVEKTLSGCGKGFSGQTKGEWCVAVWCIWLAVRGLP